LIIFIFLVAIFIIGYSFNLFSGIKFGKEGNIIFEQKTEPGTPTIVPQFAQDYLAWENFSKKDLLFVVWYKLKLNFSKDLAGEISNLNFSFKLPGKIINHNTSRIEKGTAIWEKIPPDGILILETRLIRWWLIVLTLILGFFVIWLGRQKLREKDVEEIQKIKTY